MSSHKRSITQQSYDYYKDKEKSKNFEETPTRKRKSPFKENMFPISNNLDADYNQQELINSKCANKSQKKENVTLANNCVLNNTIVLKTRQSNEINREIVENKLKELKKSIAKNKCQVIQFMQEKIKESDIKEQNSYKNIYIESEGITRQGSVQVQLDEGIISQNKRIGQQIQNQQKSEGYNQITYLTQQNSRKQSHTEIDNENLYNNKQNNKRQHSQQKIRSPYQQSTQHIQEDPQAQIQLNKQSKQQIHNVIGGSNHTFNTEYPLSSERQFMFNTNRMKSSGQYQYSKIFIPVIIETNQQFKAEIQSGDNIVDLYKVEQIQRRTDSYVVYQGLSLLEDSYGENVFLKIYDQSNDGFNLGMNEITNYLHLYEQKINFQNEHIARMRDFFYYRIWISDLENAVIVDKNKENSINDCQQFKIQPQVDIHYASPEIILGVERDHKSDIWSLGTILYELLTNEQLFKTSNNKEIIYMIKKIFESKKNSNSEKQQLELLTTNSQINNLNEQIAIVRQNVKLLKESPFLYDLVIRLLQVNPLKRISVEQILQHKWILNAPQNIFNGFQ